MVDIGGMLKGEFYRYLSVEKTTRGCRVEVDLPWTKCVDNYKKSDESIKEWLWDGLPPF